MGKKEDLDFLSELVQSSQNGLPTLAEATRKARESEEVASDVYRLRSSVEHMLTVLLPCLELLSTADLRSEPAATVLGDAPGLLRPQLHTLMKKALEPEAKGASEKFGRIFGRAVKLPFVPNVSRLTDEIIDGLTFGHAREWDDG